MITINEEIQKAIQKETRMINGEKKEVTHYLGKPMKRTKVRPIRIHIVNKKTNCALCNNNIQIVTEVKNFLMDKDEVCKTCLELYDAFNGGKNNG